MLFISWLVAGRIETAECEMHLQKYRWMMLKGIGNYLLTECQCTVLYKYRYNVQQRKGLLVAYNTPCNPEPMTGINHTLHVSKVTH